MCDTCGCGQPGDEVIIKKPDEITEGTENTTEHNHTTLHNHSHSHSHNHNHLPHNHEHEHNHAHGKVITVETDILSKNNLMAERNCGFFDAKNIFSLNLVSSPGSGKTTLLEKTLRKLKDKISFYVIEGDQQTMNDAERIFNILILLYSDSCMKKYIKILFRNINRPNLLKELYL